MMLLTVLLRIVGTAIVYLMYVLLVRYLIMGQSIMADIYNVERTVYHWAYRHEQPLDITLRRLSALRRAVERGDFNDDTGILDGEYRHASDDGEQQSGPSGGSC